MHEVEIFWDASSFEPDSPGTTGICGYGAPTDEDTPFL